MADRKVTFESLPKELLLAVFAEVEFSKENFTNLTLVNRDIYDLLVNNQRILHDIAVKQFPHALYAARFSGRRIAFTAEPSQVSVNDLGNFQRLTGKIGALVRDVEQTRQRMVDRKVLGSNNYLRTWGGRTTS